MNGENVKRVSSTKFLGVIVDEHLKWYEHIKLIKNKISKGIGLLCKARKVLNISTILNMYYTFVYPYLTYCIEVWGSASECAMQSILKMQKRAVRIITVSKCKAHTAELFYSTKILDVFKVYKYCLLIFMFKYNHNMLPQVFNNMFAKNVDVHHHYTRQQNQLHIPEVKNTISHKAVHFQGVLLWNNLINEMVDIYDCSLSAFKHKLKCMLLETSTQ